jgi:rSAM/selenodomain-associated transferase 1
VTSPDPSRVVAIMAKAPRAGHVKTRLSAVFPPDAVLELYRALVEDSIGVATRIGASIAVVCPAGDSEDIGAWLPSDVRIVPQRGSGLAEGLISCFDMLCDRSGRRVIAFNSDTPHLPSHVLDSAFGALADHDVVIGPCDDGGYYLVGVTRSHAGLFDPQAMGTGSACDALIDRTRSLGLSAAVISAQYDVDLPRDLVRLARELSSQPQCAPRTAAVLSKWPTGPTGAIAPIAGVMRRGQV